MLPQDNRATPPAGAQGAPSPNDHIVQRAHGWNECRKEVIGSTGDAKTKAKSKFRLAERDLAEACDHAVRRAQP